MKKRLVSKLVSLFFITFPRSLCTAQFTFTKIAVTEQRAMAAAQAAVAQLAAALVLETAVFPGTPMQARVKANYKNSKRDFY